jgi:hypothetical protein
MRPLPAIPLLARIGAVQLDAQGPTRRLGVVVLDEAAVVRLQRVHGPLGKREVTRQNVARGWCSHAEDASGYC